MIAEHLYVDDGFTIGLVQRSLSEAVWRSDGTDEEGRKLALKCPHPALDMALTEQVEELDQHRRLLHASGREGRLAFLPGIFTSGDVEPEVRAGRKAYERPHLSFQLDQRRVRDLLMGEQLYGEPGLALRELLSERAGRLPLPTSTGSLLAKTTGKIPVRPS